MQAVSDQLRAGFEAECSALETNREVLGERARGLLLSSPVKSVAPGLVMLKSGERVQCDFVVVAAEGPSAASLLEAAAASVAAAAGNTDAESTIKKPVDRSSTCVYFGLPASEVPVEAPVLVLDGVEMGRSVAEQREGVALSEYRVNNLCFPSTVAPGYAPEGRALCSATLLGECGGLGDAELAHAVKAQIDEWFQKPGLTQGWDFLRAYRIKHAQPAQTLGGSPRPFDQGPETGVRGVYCCGDHRSTATLNGAMESGRAAASLIRGKYTRGGAMRFDRRKSAASGA